MPMMPTRCVLGVCGALFLGGCADKFDMVTQALMTDPEDLSTSVTDGGGATIDMSTEATATEAVPTDGGEGPSTPGDDTDNDPTADTTGAPATCDGPEECTAEGSGDVGPLTLPFFRGVVCVSDKVQPGDKVAFSVSQCSHPCLDVSGYGFKYSVRGGPDSTVEAALAHYYTEVTGTACPSDVFGEFPAEACVLGSPLKSSMNPILQNDDPFAGSGVFLVPFLTNDDAAAVKADTKVLWDKADAHAQAEARAFALSFDAGNSPAPAECGEGVAGCTCRSIGL